MADLIATLAAAAGAAGEAAGYQIERSLRFNSADSAYLSRSFSYSTRTKQTFSFWVKRSGIGATTQNVLGFYDGTASFSAAIGFTSDAFRVRSGGAAENTVTTTQLFRDPSAWYHFVIAIDTTQATAADRVKIYVNGGQITAFSSANYPTQNSDSQFGANASNNRIGTNFVQNAEFLNAYLTEFYFIQDQALTPSDFGETDADTGVWKPKAYAGTYGTNGFYLNFSDNTSGTTIGYDYSGNSNNWTTNNISVSAGVGNDSLVDTPTPYGTDQGLGGEVRGNYATWNPLDSSASSWLKNGNLDSPYAPTAWANAKSTLSMSSGKWYFEATMLETWIYGMIGVWTTSVQLPSLSATNYLGGFASGWVYQTNGVIWNNNVSSTSGILSVASGDIVNIAVDADAGKIWFGKNGTWFNSGDPAAGTNAAYSNLPSEVSAAVGIYNAASGMATNFGQRPFAYTAPSGFKALCTQNLPDPTVVQGDDYFNTVLYTGTGSSQSITGVGFQPDWVWIKERSGAADHGLYDAVRGVQQQLESNTTTAETTESTGLTAFGSDGFTVGALAQLNTNTDTYVAWNWNAGGSNATNTDGTITSTVRANPTAGFSIVTYTGNGGNASATIGHGLGVAPQMMILKFRDIVSAWSIYHASLGNTQRLRLDTTDAPTTDSTYWNNTNPTSTVFTVGSTFNQNSVYDYLVYCFAEIEGYSKFGSYTGNSSADGTFVYTGFRPAFVLFKISSGADNWYILDAERSTSNVVKARIFPNLSNAEDSTYTICDFVSNGFKFRSSDASWNSSSGTYIYMAFAENPFKYSLAR